MTATEPAATASLRDDTAQINLLLGQAAQALALAEQRQELSAQRAAGWSQALKQVDDDLAAQRVAPAAARLAGLCQSVE